MRERFPWDPRARTLLRREIHTINVKLHTSSSDFVHLCERNTSGIFQWGQKNRLPVPGKLSHDCRVVWGKGGSEIAT